MAARPLSRAATEVREALIARIRAHTAHVGVVGLGYVGLPFAVEKAKVGFPVAGIEQNPLRAAAVNRGRNYIPDVNESTSHGKFPEAYAAVISSASRQPLRAHDRWHDALHLRGRS